MGKLAIVFLVIEKVSAEDFDITILNADITALEMVESPFSFSVLD